MAEHGTIRIPDHEYRERAMHVIFQASGRCLSVVVLQSHLLAKQL